VTGAASQSAYLDVKLNTLVPNTGNSAVWFTGPSTVFVGSGNMAVVSLHGVEFDGDRVRYEPVPGSQGYVNGRYRVLTYVGERIALQPLTIAGRGFSKRQSRRMTLPSYFKVNSAGTLNPCVSVHWVNARLDNVANSDFLCVEVACVAPVTVTSLSPFCTSFVTADWPSESLNGGTDSWT
jgi:hypothetical protein